VIAMSAAMPRPGRGSKIAWIASALSAALIIFFVENLWIDKAVRNRHHHAPTFIPDAQSGMWFLVFTLAAIAFVLLIACLVLIFRNRSLSWFSRFGTTILVLLALVLGAQWFQITNGKPGLEKFLRSKKPHKIVLSWQASSSPVAGYNIYRKDQPGANFRKLNASPIHGLTYTDETVENETTYYYVTRAVDSQGAESVSSNQFIVDIP
jgi:hypothetical protein